MKLSGVLLGMILGILLMIVVFLGLPFLFKFKSTVPAESASKQNLFSGKSESQSLETKLKQVASAANSVTPIKLNSTTEVFKVLSNQNTLIYYIRDLNFVLPQIETEIDKSKVDYFINKLTPSIQKLIAEEVCTNKVNLVLLNEGVIIRYEIHDKQKIKYMEIPVNKSDCR